MKKIAFILTVTIITLTFILSACSSSPAASPTAAATSSESGATLVQQRCSMCHPYTFVESFTLTAAEWKAVVDQMIARGAQLTPGEETVVVNYLSINFGR